MYRPMTGRTVIEGLLFIFYKKKNFAFFRFFYFFEVDFGFQSTKHTSHILYTLNMNSRLYIHGHMVCEIRWKINKTTEEQLFSVHVSKIFLLFCISFHSFAFYIRTFFDVSSQRFPILFHYSKGKMSIRRVCGRITI